jgi:hypothetical protein
MLLKFENLKPQLWLSWLESHNSLRSTVYG